MHILIYIDVFHIAKINVYTLTLLNDVIKHKSIMIDDHCDEACEVKIWSSNTTPRILTDLDGMCVINPS